MTSDEKNVLLIATVGNTDMQFVVDGKRGAPDKQKPIHQALLEGNEWVIDESKVSLEKLAKGSHDFSFDQCSKDSEGRVIIVPGKLAPIADHYQGRLWKAVVLATRRESGETDEPIACGPILAGWLKAKIDVRQPVIIQEPWTKGELSESAAWVNILSEGRLEGPGNCGIRVEVVRVIEEALKRIAEGNPPENLEVVVAVTGGIGSLKPIVEAAVRLQLGSARVCTVTLPDGRSDIVKHGLPHAPSKADIVAARLQALHHVERADFVAARVILDTMVGTDPQAAKWRSLIDRTSRWFAAEAEIGSPPESWLTALDQLKWSERAALRAEAALRAGRWHEAIVWSVSFHDVALLDAIRSLDWVQDLSFLEKVVICGQVPDKLPRGLLTHGADNRYRYNVLPRTQENWRSLMSDDIGSSMRALHTALWNNRGDGPPLTEYRNAVVHGRLTGPEVERAIEAFKERGMWAGSPPSFLDSQPVTGFLNSLESGSADRLKITFSALLVELGKALRDPSLWPGEGAAQPEVAASR